MTGTVHNNSSFSLSFGTRRYNNTGQRLLTSNKFYHLPGLRLNILKTEKIAIWGKKFSSFQRKRLKKRIFLLVNLESKLTDLIIKLQFPIVSIVSFIL